MDALVPMVVGETMNKLIAFLVVVAGAAAFLVFTTPWPKCTLCTRLCYGLRSLRLLSAAHIVGLALIP